MDEQAVLPQPGSLSRLRGTLLKCTSAVFYWLCLLLFLFLGATSLLFTSFFPASYEEAIQLGWDSPLLVLLFAALVLAAVCGLFRLQPWRWLALRWWRLLLCVYVLAAGTLWVFMVFPEPVADSWNITDIAAQFAHDDFGALGYYLGKYPYQLGYTLLAEGVYRLFGTEGTTGWLVLQLLNVPFAALCAYSITKIAAALFDSERVHFLSILLMFGCLPPIFFVTFIYGNTISTALALLALQLALAYRATGRWRLLLAVAPLCGLATAFKNFSLIFVIGTAILLALEFIRRPRLPCILSAVLAIAAAFCTLPLLYAWVTQRSGIAVQQGIPLTAWIVMGLRESPMGPGWYNRLNEYLYNANDGSYTLTNTAALQAIGQSVQGFLQNPAEAISFFFRKALSQWNEPSYQSLWVGHYVGQHLVPLNALTARIYGGGLNSLIMGYMNGYHFIIYGGAAAGLLMLRKRLAAWQLAPAVIILGGFVFQLVWEAKSQYILPYFLLAVPYAARRRRA